MPLPTRLSAELFASPSGMQPASVPPSTVPRRAVDVSVLAHGSSAKGDVLELRAQVAFLEDVVKRQAAELARNVAGATSGVDLARDPALREFVQVGAMLARRCLLESVKRSEHRPSLTARQFFAGPVAARRPDSAVADGPEAALAAVCGL